VESPELRRFALLLQYDGASFHGWQLQPDLPTVQGVLERVLSRLTGGVRVPVTGSGRTDTGVHATGQVASVDLPRSWTPEALGRSLNALLPSSIRASDVCEVASTFHPRFDARRRRYVYRVGTGPLAHSPFLAPTCWALRAGPAVEPARLAAAARHLVGIHNFRAFARSGQEERGHQCEVFEAEWSPWSTESPPFASAAPLGWIFQITANRYLHHMVRYLVGTQVAAARGLRPVDDLGLLLRDGPGRGRLTSPPAPPGGLFLDRVEYEDGIVAFPSLTPRPGLAP
jgi:tRNA pseudouridine38-40 synthase